MRKFIVVAFITMFIGITAHSQTISSESLNGYWKVKKFSMGKSLEKDFNVAQMVFYKIAVKYIARNSFIEFKKDGSYTFSLAGDKETGNWEFDPAEMLLKLKEKDGDEVFKLEPKSKRKVIIKLEYGSEEGEALVVKLKKKFQLF